MPEIAVTRQFCYREHSKTAETNEHAGTNLRPYVDMIARFRLLTKNEDGTYRTMTPKDFGELSVGGFWFVIDGKSVPFDFEASATAIDEEDGVITYQSGFGPFFNAHYLDGVFDDEYEDLGITRASLTAKKLASVTRIEEFYMTAWDDKEKECGIGDNSDSGSDLHIELLDMQFTDEIADVFEVGREVLDAFNSGHFAEE